MKTKYKIASGVVLFAALVAVTGWYLHLHTVDVLQPAGKIGYDERNLIIWVTALSGGVVIPVFGMLGYFAWKYREDNHRAKYEPEFDSSKKAETIWWLIPTVLLVIISVINWRSSYALDPFKALDGTKPTLRIQVVALDWKWLFIYPDQQVASVNDAAIPVGVPVDFEITSDTVMTSFWAPRLGGQMYAMPGMSTHLNLVADKPGDFKGSAANISGKGFADMTFMVHAVNDTNFDTWMSKSQLSGHLLTAAEYGNLSRPGTMKEPTYYSTVDRKLYDTIVMKYMMPMGGTNLHGVTE
jgi:cytochrome o ubiquinol oxidase subunit 2